AAFLRHGCRCTHTFESLASLRARSLGSLAPAERRYGRRTRNGFFSFRVVPWKSHRGTQVRRGCRTPALLPSRSWQLGSTHITNHESRKSNILELLARVALGPLSRTCVAACYGMPACLTGPLTAHYAALHTRTHRPPDGASEKEERTTVDTLLIHSPRDRPEYMGFEGLWATRT
ncbi:hypothetical protein BD311DRAFT_833996, partial [Dichomitus squalens]